MTTQTVPDYRKVENAMHDLFELIHEEMAAQPGPESRNPHWSDLYAMSRLINVAADLAASAADRAGAAE